MTYAVDINGRTRRVEVEHARGAFVVTVDGRRRIADVTVVKGVWSLILAIDADGNRRSYEVVIEEHPDRTGSLTVHVNGCAVAAMVGSRGISPRHSHDASSGHDDAAPRPVTAPMPGKVVRVLVRQGDVVAARQGVVVVEAMKMENELRSPKAGRVKDVQVTAGTSVEAGRVLVVIE